jgi:NAD(P)H-hydrate epimerase
MYTNPSFPTIPKHTVPRLSTAQMIEVDRRMVETYGIELKQMMENAGRNLARLSASFLPVSQNKAPKVVVLCGTGGNGGGGMVCARHLSNWGAAISIVLTKAEKAYAGVPAHQLAILKKTGIPFFQAADLKRLPECDLIIDAIIGYSLNGRPHGNAAKIIRWANEQAAAVLSLDIPSGMEGGSGAVKEPAVRARATMTLALPKQGLLAETARRYTGRLFLADISVPPSLYKQAFGFRVAPLFSESEIIELI